MNWNFWIGKSKNNQPVLFVKHLVHLFGCRIDLHKMENPDAPGIYHSHPATAIRIVLRGGYWEAIPVEGKPLKEEYYQKRPGHISVVRPDFVHRIAALSTNKPSYSLWIRGRITDKIKLSGPGVTDQDTSHHEI